MQTHKTKIFKRLLSFAIVVFAVVMLSSRCASVSMPLGGPYDTLPPRVLFIDPNYGTTNFSGKRITMTFDEYILLKNQSTEFYTSPGMEKTPTLTIRGKSLQIDLVSPLDSNTTYALNFGNTIADNNEGNLFKGFRYVFSTGSAIDSLLMSGYTVDAYTGDTLGNVFIYFFDDATADSLMRLRPWDTVEMVAMDSSYLDTLASSKIIDTLAVKALVDTLEMVSMDSTILDTLATDQLVDTISKQGLKELDSMLYKVKPNAIARSFTNGIFIAENLAGKNYRIYAFMDNNSNKTYDPGVDLVAFSDSLYNPLEMSNFTIWYDTVQRRLQAEPQVYFRLFKETFVNTRANLGSITRPEKQRLYVTFTGSYPKIESIEFDSIPSDSIITEYLTVGKDTLSLWLNQLPKNLPDSVAGRLIYQKYDSVNVLKPDTVRFNLGWFEAQEKERNRESRRDRSERGGGQEQRGGENMGGDMPPRPEGQPEQPPQQELSQEQQEELSLEEQELQDQEQQEEIPTLDVSIKTSGTKHNHEDRLEVPFTMPLRDVDTLPMQLYQLPLKDGEPEVVVPMSFAQDTLDIKKWWIESTWEPDRKYRVLIPQSALRDISGAANDTVSYEFTTDSPERYGTFILNMINTDPDKHYIVQLIKDGKVVEERIHVEGGKLKIQYLSPGDHSIRIMEDNNKNGIWDTGELRDRRQPELVANYVDGSGSEKIMAKLNWEMEFDVDVSKLFGPVNMDDVLERIVRMEREAQKKRDEQRQKNQQQKK